MAEEAIDAWAVGAEETCGRGDVSGGLLKGALDEELLGLQEVERQFRGRGARAGCAFRGVPSVPLIVRHLPPLSLL